MYWQKRLSGCVLRAFLHASTFNGVMISVSTGGRLRGERGTLPSKAIRSDMYLYSPFSRQPAAEGHNHFGAGGDEREERRGNSPIEQYPMHLTTYIGLFVVRSELSIPDCWADNLSACDLQHNTRTPLESH